MVHVQVKDKLSAEPRRLAYLPTCLVKYQSFASGHVNGVSVGTKPITIFRLQEPLVMGNFVKWSSNAGEALAQCVRCISRVQ